jgi:hypothetical protein
VQTTTAGNLLGRARVLATSFNRTSESLHQKLVRQVEFCDRTALPNLTDMKAAPSANPVDLPAVKDDPLFDDAQMVPAKAH